MNKGYNNEIESLEKCYNIKNKNKLTIFAFYFELYMNLIDVLDDTSKENKEEYLEFLESSFLLNCTNINLSDQETDVNSFYESFFKLLMTSSMSKQADIKELIEVYQKDVDVVVRGMDHIPYINMFNFDFKHKVDTLLIFRNYINNIYIKMYETYGESGYFQRFVNIYNDIYKILPAICDNDLEIFKKKLSEESNRIIKEKIINLEKETEYKELLKTIIIKEDEDKGKSF